MDTIYNNREYNFKSVFILFCNNKPSKKLKIIKGNVFSCVKFSCAEFSCPNIICPNISCVKFSYACAKFSCVNLSSA